MSGLVCYPGTQVEIEAFIRTLPSALAATAADWRVIITGIAGENGRTGLNGQVGDSGGEVTFRFFQHLEGNIGSSAAITSTTALLAFFG